MRNDSGTILRPFRAPFLGHFLDHFWGRFLVRPHRFLLASAPQKYSIFLMNFQLTIPAGLGGAESWESLKVDNSSFQFNYWIIHHPNCCESSEFLQTFTIIQPSSRGGTFWQHFGCHSGSVSASIPGSFLAPFRTHFGIHFGAAFATNTSKTKRFGCLGGSERG